MPSKPTTLCRQCGIVFASFPSAKRVYCSRACRSAYLQATGEVREYTCAQCGTEFATVGVRQPRKYCSDPCARLASRRPPQIKRCEWCGSEFTDLARDVGSAHCSKECAHRTRTQKSSRSNTRPKVLVTCTICGKQKMIQRCWLRGFKTCSRQCTGALSQRSMPKVSSLETKMLAALEALGLNPVHQHPVRFYTIDLAFPEVKLAVECDGVYWHRLPANQRRDRAKNTYLTDRGWTMIRLPEQDIKASPQACAAKVKKILTALLRRAKSEPTPTYSSHEPATEHRIA
jgi:very-short-patch-repair endonuclease